MKCPECGSRFEGNFCPNCGHKAEAGERCPKCGRARQSDERFCPNCGYAYPAGTQTSAAADKAYAPETKAQSGDGFFDAPAAAEKGKKAGGFSGSHAFTPDIETDKKGKPKVPELLLPYKYTCIMAIILAALWMSFMFPYMQIVQNKILLESDITWMLAAIAAAYVIVIAAVVIYKLVGMPLVPLWRTGNGKPAKPFTVLNTLLVNAIAFGILSIALPVGLLFARGENEIRYTGLYALCMVVDVAVFAAIIVAILIIRGRNKKRINLAYYGKEKPDKTDKPVVSGGYVISTINAYNHALKQYWLAPRRRKCAADGATLSGVEVSVSTFLRGTLTRLLIIVLAIAGVIMVIYPAMTNMRNIFRTAVAEQIERGMDAMQVEQLFGSPYSRSDSYDTPTPSWIYYPDDYKKLLERNENFDPGDIQDEDDLENAFNEAAELERATYEYIEITFEDDKVISVLFDAHRTGRQGPFRKSAPESVEVTAGGVQQGDTDADITYIARYADGSYYMGSAANVYVDPAASSGETGSKVAAEWNDPFGNTVTGEVTITEQIADSYDEGYEAGREAGYADGYEGGLADDNSNRDDYCDSPYEEYREGYADGYNYGYSSGYSDGYNARNDN